MQTRKGGRRPSSLEATTHYTDFVEAVNRRFDAYLELHRRMEALADGLYRDLREPLPEEAYLRSPLYGSEDRNRIESAKRDLIDAVVTSFAARLGLGNLPRGDLMEAVNEAVIQARCQSPKGEAFRYDARLIWETLQGFTDGLEDRALEALREAVRYLHETITRGTHWHTGAPVKGAVVRLSLFPDSDAQSLPYGERVNPALEALGKLAHLAAVGEATPSTAADRLTLYRRLRSGGNGLCADGISYVGVHPIDVDEVVSLRIFKNGRIDVKCTSPAAALKLSRLIGEKHAPEEG